jgi:hypothetical protein
MALALLWIAVTLSVGWPPKALLAGEWTAWAFGASWFAKGSELPSIPQEGNGAY